MDCLDILVKAEVSNKVQWSAKMPYFKVKMFVQDLPSEWPLALWITDPLPRGGGRVRLIWGCPILRVF